MTEFFAVIPICTPPHQHITCGLSTSRLRRADIPKSPLQHYLIVWSFPTVEGAWKSCPGFAEYINAGAPGDKFDGFELKYRVCEPVSGSGVAIAEASDIGKVWAHLGPWIKGYGIEFDVTAVVSDAQFAAMWPGVEAAAAVE